MAETFFDIVVRARNLVSQGMQEALAQAKATAAKLSDINMGGVGGSFGKIGLTVEGVKGAFRLAGAAAAAFKGDMGGVDAALSKLPMGMGEVYQAARDLGKELFEVGKMAEFAAQQDRWDKLAESIDAAGRAAARAGLKGSLRNDFARQRLDAQDSTNAQIAEIKSKLREEIGRARKSEMDDEDPTTLTPMSGEESKLIEKARRAIGELEREQQRSLQAIGESELRKNAADYNARLENAKRIKDRLAKDAEDEWQKKFRLEEDLARLKADNAAMALEQEGKLLEAAKARNAEAERGALALARNDEERKLIADRRKLSDRAAEQDEAKRLEALNKKEQRATKDRSAGFELVEVTSRVAGLAAMQRNGVEVAVKENGQRVEGALAKLQAVCGQGFDRLMQKQIGGIPIGL